MGLKFNPLLNSGFDNAGSGGSGVTSVNGDTGAVTVAKTDLSNLTSTNINQPLQTADTSGNSNALSIKTGNTSAINSISGAITISSGSSNGDYSGDVTVTSGTGGGSLAFFTGNLLLKTGNNADGGSGNITIQPGTAGSGFGTGSILLKVTSAGTPATITFQDGSQGTTGHVWTSTDTIGNGHWASTAGWSKYTKTYSDFSTAATTNNITLFSLSAKTVIHEIIIHHTAAFTGTSISAYTISVGVTGNLTRFASAWDVFQTASDTVSRGSLSGEVPDFGSATSIKIAATSTGANLNAASGTGSVDIYVRTSTLP